jgi:hypothetical protein
MAETKREEEHKPEADHGVEVSPYRVIPPNAGWLVCPENTVKYDGENEPWRR